MSVYCKTGPYIPPPAASAWPRINSENISDKDARAMASLLQLDKGPGLYNGSIYWTKPGSTAIITKADISNHWLSGEEF